MALQRNLGPRLVELTGATAGRIHELPYGELMLGRGGGADVLLDDGDVSRQHARLEVTVDGVRVHDLGSKNGIVADGARVDGSVLRTHGQTFSIGALQLRVFHPATQVTRALVDAGETTATTSAPSTLHDPKRWRSLLIPAVGVAVFSALLVAMLLG